MPLVFSFRYDDIDELSRVVKTAVGGVCGGNWLATVSMTRWNKKRSRRFGLHNGGD